MRVILSLLALLLFAQSSYSQGFMWGIRGGASRSGIKINAVFNDTTYRKGTNQWGYHVGVWGRVSLLRFIYIQPEALFTNAGGDIEVETPQNALPSPYNVKVRYNRIDIPVMIGIKLAFLRIQAGPTATILLNASSENTLLNVKNDITDNFNTATIGYQAGVGVDLGRRLILDLKYEGNLSQFGDEIAGFSTDLRANQLILSVGLGL